MTTAAWVFMLTVWTIVILATIYCFAKLLSSSHLLEYDDEGNRIEPWGEPTGGNAPPPDPGP